MTDFSESILRTFEHKPIDRIVWQPRIMYWYQNNRIQSLSYAKYPAVEEFVPKEYLGKSVKEIYKDIKGSIRYPQGTFGFTLFHSIRKPNHQIKTKRKRLGSKTYLVKTTTPIGEISHVEKDTRIIKFPVKKVEDLKVMMYIEEQTDFTFSDTMYEKAKKEMEGFSYIEHRDNVALALAVCQHLKIDREVALKGMYQAIPDAGALRRYKVDAFHKKLFFYNAFAANDPDSTYMVWQKIRDEIGLEGVRIILLNTRQDRLDRAKQLAELAGKKLTKEIDHLILIGQSTDVVENLTINYGLSQKKIINLGWTTPAKVFEKVLSLTEKLSTTLAIGNMGGMGAETAQFFENRSS